MSEANRIVDKNCQRSEQSLEQSEPVTLCEVLDRILNKGVVVMGELTLSLANVDLLYLNVRLLLTTIDHCKNPTKKSERNENDI